MKRRLEQAPIFAALLLLWILIPGPSWGADPEDTESLTEHEPERAWLETYDPTLISRRLLLESEYEDGGARDSLKWSLNLRYSVTLEKDLALGAQIVVPIKWMEFEDDRRAGLSNLEARVGFVGRLSSDWRWGLGVNGEFPTVSDPSLGPSAFILRPIAAVRWDVTKKINLGVNVEYSLTPGTEGAHRFEALELKFPVTFKINSDLSANVTYKPRWNFVQDSSRNRLEIGLTRLLGSTKEYAISLSGEVPLSDENFVWKATIGFTWFYN